MVKRCRRWLVFLKPLDAESDYLYRRLQSLDGLYGAVLRSRAVLEPLGLLAMDGFRDTSTE